MEFMPQSYEVDNTIVSPTNYKSVTEIEIAASASIQEPSSEENIQQSQQRGQPIYCSDGIIYPGEPNQTKIETVNQSDDQTVALSNDLVEVYQNLGLLGKLLAGGSLVTMRFLQAFRTLGESVVDVLGINRPRYEYEVNMYKQMQEQEKQRNQKLDQLYSTWQPGSSPVTSIPPVNHADVDNSAILPSPQTSSVLNMEHNVMEHNVTSRPVEMQNPPLPQNLNPNVLQQFEQNVPIVGNVQTNVNQ
ncbi:hypothetical protein BLOT_004654 [Blomia tropicalis]|nr:hypothetical protein BLOT_004654 [Blomia tropicalis]